MPPVVTKGNSMKGSSRQQAQGTLQPHKDRNSIYADVATTLKEDTIMDLQADGGDCEAWATMCACPPPPIRTHTAPSIQTKATSQDCYMRIEDKMMRTALQAGNHITVPGFICDAAKILHVCSIACPSPVSLQLR